MKRILAIALTIFAAMAFWLLAAPRARHQAASHPAVAPAAYDPAQIGRTVAFFEEQVKRDPRGAIGYAMLADNYLRRFHEKGDTADILHAERAARRSLALRTSRNAAAYHHLARSLMSQHRFAEALEGANRAAAMEPDDVQAAYLQAECRLELGNYAACADVLRRAALLSDDPFGKTLNARLMEINGKQQAALDLYRQAREEAGRIEGLPVDTRAWFRMRLGDCLARMGRLPDAEASYREALAIFPRDYRTLSALARLEAARENWPAAIEWASKASMIQPSMEMTALLGDAYTAMGQMQEARHQYSLIHANGSTLHMHDRQHALYNANHNVNLDEALAIARRDLKMRQDIYAYDTLAWACLKNGLLSEADAAMKHALARGTEDAVLFYHAGCIARARSKYGKARTYLSRALAINPYFDPAQARDARAALAFLNTTASR